MSLTSTCGLYSTESNLCGKLVNNQNIPLDIPMNNSFSITFANLELCDGKMSMLDATVCLFVFHETVLVIFHQIFIKFSTEVSIHNRIMHVQINLGSGSLGGCWVWNPTWDRSNAPYRSKFEHGNMPMTQRGNAESLCQYVRQKRECLEDIHL